MFKVVAHTPTGKFEAKFSSEEKEKIYDLCRDGNLDFISFKGLDDSDTFVLRSDVFSKTVFEFIDLDSESED